MPGVQQIIEWLGCLTTHQHRCRGCPFNPYPGREWIYGCIKGQADIVEAARDALRKYQEASDDGKRNGS